MLCGCLFRVCAHVARALVGVYVCVCPHVHARALQLRCVCVRCVLEHSRKRVCAAQG